MKRALFAAALALTACAGGAKVEPPLAPEPPAIHVQTTPVTNKPMPHELPLTGELIANQQSDLAANGAGKVVKTLIDRGSYVKAGETLVQLDTKSAALAEAEARANLETAEASQELATTLCKRNQELFDKGAISREEWDRTSNQCKTSSASSAAARARADMASKTLSDATVRAPFSGMISQRFVSVGEYVQPATRVVTMVELDPLRLQLTVPEVDVGQIKEGQTVRFSVEAFDKQSFTGTVKFIDPTVRATTRDLIVEAVVPNADRTLKPGMFATAHLELPDQPMATIPSSAVRMDSGRPHVFVVAAGHIQERIVQLGATRGDDVAVTDGLQPGDQVVSVLNDEVKDGVPVK